MSGKSETTQNSQQQSQLTPWAPATPGLQGILGGLGGSIDQMGGNAQTNAAFDQLYQNGGQPNPLGGAAMGAAGSMLGGGQNYDAATGMLKSNYANTANALSPYTSGNAMDPNSNPALRQQLNTVNSDVMGQVNPMFSAAGRLGSPDNYQAVGRGIAQGSTGILQNAAQNNLGAISTMAGLGGSTAGGLLGADQSRAGIQSGGIAAAPGAYGAQNLGPMQQLQAAMGKLQLPMQNASQLTGILGPLAGMFGQQNGTGSQQGTQTMSPWQMMTSGVNAFGNVAKAFS